MNVKSVLILFSAIIALLVNTTALSQNEKPKQAVSPLTYADKNEFDRKKKTVDQLGRRYFGTGLRGDKSDLALLQKIADKKIIKQDNTEDLQALGVVLGNVLQKDLELDWMVYEDQYGRSRALCVPQSSNCLFPTTMLSRYLEVGEKVDVEQAYVKAVKLIDPYLPDTNAYDGIKPDPNPKPSWTGDRKKSPTTIPIR